MRGSDGEIFEGGESIGAETGEVIRMIAAVENPPLYPFELGLLSAGGGAGFEHEGAIFDAASMEEYPVCRFYRDVAAFGIGAGTSEIMREIIAKEAIG